MVVMQQRRWRGCGIHTSQIYLFFSLAKVFRCPNYVNALHIAVFYHISALLGELYVPQTDT